MISGGFVCALYLVRALFGMIRGEIPLSVALLEPLWVLGLFVVNTLLGGLAFLVIRGTARLFEGGAQMGEDQEVEAPPTTWNPDPTVTGEEPPRAEAAAGPSGHAER